ncbi:sensor histidine kinase [Streptomyces sp. NBC_01142]|uniref:sensor histidine kinase n=1 Tax=Streptomyces sp. NBC_01142 TaxID=2975865 RepID=UPI00225174D8|nr:sensor histidine kinase [Streptomyces sp. NBC_01142]MCX4822834.1 sensor histidine kinase [Streptomyces sp. NBC_01142]
MKALALKGVRYAVGLTLGAATAVVEAVFALFAGVVLLLVLAWPRGRRAVLRPLGRAAARLADLERRRLDRFLGVRISAPQSAGRPTGNSTGYPAAHPAAYGSEGEHPLAELRYVAARWPLGALGAVVLFCVLIGAAYGTFFLYAWLITDLLHPLTVILGSLAGLFLLFLSLQGIFGVALLEGHLARHLLGPSHQDELERRITELATSRAEVMDAVTGERRRIERDLHDGVQQRLVALGMLLGRARRSRDPERADQLLLQAHEESRRALAELRDVAWRVYPTVLDEAGLRAALETVAERTPLPVNLEYAVAAEPTKQVETVAYFVVSEAVTNVVKHSGATRIDVTLRRHGEALNLRVEDDGTGGADPAGGGLTGLASRVAALDGRFGVDSPAGGPTVITAELPCA